MINLGAWFSECFFFHSLCFLRLMLGQRDFCVVLAKSWIVRLCNYFSGNSADPYLFVIWQDSTWLIGHDFLLSAFVNDNDTSPIDVCKITLTILLQYFQLCKKFLLW